MPTVRVVNSLQAADDERRSLSSTSQLVVNPSARAQEDAGRSSESDQECALS